MTVFVPTPRVHLWGPFALDLSDIERAARLREVRALVHVIYGSDYRAVEALLGAAAQDPTLLGEAHRGFDSLPARPQRNVAATWHFLA